MVPSASVPTHTAPCILPMRSTGLGQPRDERDRAAGSGSRGTRSPCCGRTRACASASSRSTQSGSRAMKKLAFLSPLSPRKSGMSCDSSWSTFQTLEPCRPERGSRTRRTCESDWRRIILPFSKACGGRIRHSSTIVVGEKLGRRSRSPRRSRCRRRAPRGSRPCRTVVEGAREDVAGAGVDAEEDAAP